MTKISTLIAIIIMLASTFVTHAARADNDRAIVEAFYSKLLSGTTSADLPARMAEVLAPDWQSRGDYASVAKTRDQFLKQLQGTGNILPNLTWKIEEILQVGNRYVVRGHASATPVLPFLGVEVSNRSFDIMSIDIHTVENHKIVKSYHVEDWHGATEQLKNK